MIKKYWKKSYGFTLVETLVAVSILSLSILASFTAVQTGIKSSTVARDQVTAFYMAQEAIEFIKNIRDENALHSISGVSTNWLASMAASAGDPCYFGKTCIIDSPLKTITSCSGGFGTCQNLKQDSVSGLYGYTSTWTATNFKREIQFQSVSANEITIIVKITWTNRSTSNSFQITESFFNRQ
jgi:prepilin-type N-terminal cleavage/methylation domain-containing protein